MAQPQQQRDQRQDQWPHIEDSGAETEHKGGVPGGDLHDSQEHEGREH